MLRLAPPLPYRAAVCRIAQLAVVLFSTAGIAAGIIAQVLL